MCNIEIWSLELFLDLKSCVFSAGLGSEKPEMWVALENLRFRVFVVLLLKRLLLTCCHWDLHGWCSNGPHYQNRTLFSHLNKAMFSLQNLHICWIVFSWASVFMCSTYKFKGINAVFWLGLIFYHRRWRNHMIQCKTGSGLAHWVPWCPVVLLVLQIMGTFWTHSSKSTEFEICQFNSCHN